MRFFSLMTDTPGGSFAPRSVFDRSPRALMSRGPLPRTDGCRRVADRLPVSAYQILVCGVFEPARCGPVEIVIQAAPPLTARHTRRAGRRGPGSNLSPQPELLRDRPAALDVGLGEIRQHPTALPDEDQQSAAAVVVVLVVLEVLRE